MNKPFCHRCGRNNAYCACVSIKEEIEAERAKVAKLREALGRLINFVDFDMPDEMRPGLDAFDTAVKVLDETK